MRGKGGMSRKGEEAVNRRGSRGEEGKRVPQCVGGSSFRQQCCEVPWGPARSGHHEVGPMMAVWGLIYGATSLSEDTGSSLILPRSLS